MGSLMAISDNIVHALDSAVILTTIQLLAIATHPTSTGLLYSLFGLNAKEGLYSSYQLQLWETKR